MKNNIYKKIKLLKLLAMTTLITSSFAFATHSHPETGGGLKGFNIGINSNVDNLPRVRQDLVAPPFFAKTQPSCCRRAENCRD